MKEGDPRLKPDARCRVFIKRPRYFTDGTIVEWSDHGGGTVENDTADELKTFPTRQTPGYFVRLDGQSDKQFFPLSDIEPLDE